MSNNFFFVWEFSALIHTYLLTAILAAGFLPWTGGGGGAFLAPLKGGGGGVFCFGS